MPVASNLSADEETGGGSVLGVQQGAKQCEAAAEIILPLLHMALTVKSPVFATAALP